MSHPDVTKQSLFSLSWPIFIDLFLHFATLLINTYMVSHISEAYLASMAVGNELFNIFITLFSFVSIGCSMVIAQYLGAGNQQMTQRSIHLAISLNLVLGITSALVIYFLGWRGLTIMNIPSELHQNAFDYLSILGICLIPESASLILAATLRVHGKTKIVMYITLLANFITVIGNILVLYGFFGLPKLGLVGVAWSTVIGRVVAVFLLFILLKNGLRIKFVLSYFFIWSKSLLFKILRIGVPAALENLSWGLQYTVAIAFIALLGQTALAAQTLYLQLVHFVMLCGIAVSIANEILVGYFVGAKQFDVAYKQTFRSLRFGLVATIIFVIVFWLFDKPILSFFNGNGDVIDMLLPLVLLTIVLEPGRTFNIVLVNALRAAGDAKFPLYVGVVSMWGISLPIGYYLGIKMEMGILGIWIGFFFDEWVRGVLNLWRWKSRRWEAKRLVDD